MEQNNRIKSIELDQDFHRNVNFKIKIFKSSASRVYNLTRLIGYNA